ncbi:ABC transporter permease [Rhodoferax sp. TS-BS-61-7]|uniref:ABC transporter permease n=1 Tax=Rhodoferax sp. TS-BS-61-7 TaxID=2094194 RepID=UPI001F1A7FCB|nr:ABC transporter permease [Rhodoferax sp. TS-BS-61-7]
MGPMMRALGVSLLRGVARLVLRAAAVGGIVGVVSFLLMRALPGDAAYRIAAGRYGYDMVNSAAAEAVRQELGLDRPWWVQLGTWMADLLQGRLGHSLVTGDPVLSELAHQWGHTLLLALAAWALALVLGLVGGSLVALARKTWLDQTSSTLGLALKATPTFVVGLVLAIVLAEQARWLPAAGHGGPEHLVLPGLALALGLAAGLGLVTLHSMRQVLASPSVAFAQTKGLPQTAVVWRHVLRNTAVPVVAYAGTQLVLLMEGVVVVESFFAWPGIGHALIHALVARDIPMVQGTALCMGWMFVLLNSAVDGLCWLLDPRLQHQEAS